MNSNFQYINTEYLDGVSLNPDFKKKIIGLFKKDIAEFNAEMISALKMKDYKKLSELAHKAKSSVKILGMEKQSEDMRILQNDTKSMINTESYEKVVTTFINDCQKALKEVIILENELS